MLFAPPMITGYGASNGFEFNLQDKTGGDLDRFFEVAQQFLGALNQRPEIMYAMTTFNPNFPQYMVDIDAAKCKQAGLSPKDILTDVYKRQVLRLLVRRSDGSLGRSIFLSVR